MQQLNKNNMANLLNGENSGVVVSTRPTDFMAGGETSIVYAVVESDGNWTKYKPTDEWQRRFVPPDTLGYDTNSCTDFSCMNSIEVQIEHMLANKLIPQATIDKMTALGYFDANGDVNFSDWYNAILAGTDPVKGNTLTAPWDAVRTYGCLPQSKGYAPNDFTTVDGWFGAKPTPDQIALGKQFLDIFDVAYEWVDLGNLNLWSTFDYHLKQAPLHVLVPTGLTWNDVMVKNPTPTYVGVNHAITVLAQTENISHTILDHYNPFVKSLEWGYYIPYALKGVVTLKTVPPVSAPFHYTFTKQLTYEYLDDAATKVNPAIHNDAKDLKALQQALQSLGFMKVGIFGPFGPQTKTALAAFQTAHGISDPDGQGQDFGPQTRATLNKLTQ